MPRQHSQRGLAARESNKVRQLQAAPRRLERRLLQLGAPAAAAEMGGGRAKGRPASPYLEHEVVHLRRQVVHEHGKLGRALAWLRAGVTRAASGV